MSAPETPLIIVGGDVITMNSSREVLVGGAVAIEAGRIAEVGSSSEILERWPHAKQISASGCVVTPGLINTHQHFTGDPLLKSCIPDQISSQEAIFNWAVPAHQAHTSADEELSAALCAAESALRGVTTGVEAGTVAHPHSVAQGISQIGIRAVLGIWGSDTPDLPLAGTVAEVVAQQRQLLRDFPQGGRIEGWVCLVGHDLASDELLCAASELAQDEGVGMTMHISPTPADSEIWLDRTGLLPLVHFEKLGILGRHLVLGHAVWLDSQEVEILLATETAVAFCPWAYLRLAQGTTQAGRHHEIWRQGGRVALGADAHNAGDNADMLRVAAVCAGLWRDQSMSPDSFGAHHAFELLTLGGADALGKEDQLGSIEVGKMADLVVFDARDVSWNPRGDLALQLIWGGVGHSVRDVFVDGQQIVRDFELTQLDLAELLAETAARQKVLLERTGAQLAPPWPLIQAS